MIGAPIRSNSAGQPVEGAWSDPALDLIPVVPSDTVNLPQTGRAIRCRPDGTAGTVRFISEAGNLRNTAIAVGETLPVGAVRIHATGTTATGLEILP